MVAQDTSTEAFAGLRVDGLADLNVHVVNCHRRLLSGGMTNFRGPVSQRDNSMTQPAQSLLQTLGRIRP